MLSDWDWAEFLHDASISIEKLSISIIDKLNYGIAAPLGAIVGQFNGRGS